MANTTINGIVLHNGSTAVITENLCVKESNLTELPMYSNDSDKTDVFDFGGVTKNITINGKYTASNVVDLKTWIESIEDLEQGHQDIDAGAPYTFVDDLRGTIKVKVRSFDTTYAEGEPNKINWTLSIVQSSENA